MAKKAKIFALGFVMFCDCSVAKHVLLLTTETYGIMGLGFAIYSGMIKFLRTFNREGRDFIMLLIPWLLQKVSVVISLLFL